MCAVLPMNRLLDGCRLLAAAARMTDVRTSASDA